jgi:hypothetical protein
MSAGAGPRTRTKRDRAVSPASGEFEPRIRPLIDAALTPELVLVRSLDRVRRAGDVLGAIVVLLTKDGLHQSDWSHMTVAELAWGSRALEAATERELLEAEVSL